MKTSLFACLSWSLLVAQTHPALGADSRHFLYLSDQRVITLELVDSSSAVLNYISLGDTFELLQAPYLLLLDEQGRAYRGHVFQKEDDDPAQPYTVNHLVRPREFVGYVLRGNFSFEGPIQSVALHMAGLFLELEVLSAEEFEIVAARIGELDLGLANRRLAIERAGFTRGFGRLFEGGSQEAEHLTQYVPDLARLAPVLLTNPPPRLPDRFQDLPDPVKVQVRAWVSQAGGVGKVEIVGGVDEQLDEMALATVRNSWTFLPAVANGEPSPAELVLNVFFERR